MIAWLTGTIAGPVLGALLILSTIFGAVEAVQLHGFGVTLPLVGYVGWVGAEKTAADAIADKATAVRNAATLKTGLTACNASVDAARATGVAQGASAQKAVDSAQAGVTAAQAGSAELLAIKPGANALVTAFLVGTGRQTK